MSSGSSQTRRERLEEREGVIVSAAYDEFLEHGFDGARMAKIARRAGLAEGTLYLYFRNKNALVGAVVGRFYEVLTQSAGKGVLERESTTDRLGFLVEHHLNSCIAEWSILELVVPVYWRIREYRDSDFIGFNRTYSAIFDRIIRDGVSRGELRGDLPIHFMRDLFFGTLEHSIRTYLVHGQSTDDTQSVDQIASQITSMILPALGINPPPDEAATPQLEFITQRLEAVVERLDKSPLDR